MLCMLKSLYYDYTPCHILHSYPIFRYVISSVEFDVGVMENVTDKSGESGTTAASVETDE